MQADIAPVRTIMGRLAKGAPVFACEFVIQKCRSDRTFRRGPDQESGLFWWANE